MKSMKLKNITKVRNNIIQIINSNQKIKRYLYYLTSTPQELQGINLKGETLDQPNIEIDFVNEVPRIHPFYCKSILNESEVHIFVQRRSANLKEAAVGENIISIEILVPISYAVLNDEDDRQMAIANIICTLIDDENIGGIGKAQIINHDETTTLNETKEYCALRLLVKVCTSNMKVNK